MMNGGTASGGWMNGYGAMGGYGGIWVPTLLVIAVVGLVAWIVMQKRK
jgi:ABC-type cobalamin transport system permease subunit